jgi:hypothetical protein
MKTIKDAMEYARVTAFDGFFEPEKWSSDNDEIALRIFESTLRRIMELPEKFEKRDQELANVRMQFTADDATQLLQWALEGDEC